MGLTLHQIVGHLEAEVLAYPEGLDRVVTHAQGSDLMSDVLAFSHPNCLLITGLANHQVIRTAEVAGLLGVVVVRSKRPAEAVILLAQECEVPLLSTRLGMFDACGTLFTHGIRGMSDLARPSHK
jgi:predicted transcriptional regulator